MAKPLIAQQLDHLGIAIGDLLARRCHGVICDGPTGLGKSTTARQGLGDTPYIPFDNATKAGLVALARDNPQALLYGQEYSAWLDDPKECGFLKHILDLEEGRPVYDFTKSAQAANKAVGKFDGLLLIIMNREKQVNARMAADVDAVCNKAGRTITISRDFRDLLAFLDWHVTHQFYFRSPNSGAIPASSKASADVRLRTSSHSSMTMPGRYR